MRSFNEKNLSFMENQLSELMNIIQQEGAIDELPNGIKRVHPALVAYATLLTKYNRMTGKKKKENEILSFISQE